MKYRDLRNDFKEQIISKLKEFANTEHNKDVYAIVFDCTSDVGGIYLKYSNNEHFEVLKETWDKYKSLYKPYGKNGLFGLKYNSVGNFIGLKDSYTGLTNRFLNSIYYYHVGDYWGEGEPIETMEIDGLECDNLSSLIDDIFIRMIIETIEDVKNMSQINFTEDCLVFMCDHDISNEDFKMWVEKTNDRDLVEKLANIFDEF